MTDIRCTRRRCLNNKRGWCAAHAVYYENGCQSYAPASDVMKSNAPKIKKERGRYKRPVGGMLK